MSHVDPVIFRPLLEQLSGSAISALRSQPGPCWTAALLIRVGDEKLVETDPDPSVGISSVWTLRERPGRLATASSPHGDISVPVDPTAVLNAAADVARFKGRAVVGWHLDTYVGCRAWLVVADDSKDDAPSHGRSTICTCELQAGAQVGPPMTEAPSAEMVPLYLALRVLHAADRLSATIELDGEPTAK